MTTNSAIDFVSNLERLGVASPLTVRGFSSKDIAYIEEKIRMRLPTKYREFLEISGRGVGSGFGRGIDFFFHRTDDLLDLRPAAEELLLEHKPSLSLPSDAFVFAMSQGYQFMFLIIDGNNDPPVYYYTENHNNFELKWNRFTDYLAYIVDNVERRKMGEGV